MTRPVEAGAALNETGVLRTRHDLVLEERDAASVDVAQQRALTFGHQPHPLALHEQGALRQRDIDALQDADAGATERGFDPGAVHAAPAHVTTPSRPAADRVICT